MTPIPLSSPLPAAALWDMDGTIVDTEPYWMQAEIDLVESFGGTWTHEDCLLLVGSGLEHSAAILQSRGVDLGISEIVDRLTDRVMEQLDTHGLPWRPGARELLTAFADAGVPMALVTMSITRMATQIADLIGEDTFDTIVAGDMVAQSKPHPEAYLRAAEILGVDPARCVAFEDSPPGLAAAVAAGTIAIGVPHQLDLPDHAGHTRWSTLDGRSLADIAALCRDRFDAIADPQGAESTPTPETVCAQTNNNEDAVKA